MDVVVLCLTLAAWEGWVGGGVLCFWLRLREQRPIFTSARRTACTPKTDAHLQLHVVFELFALVGELNKTTGGGGDENSHSTRMGGVPGAQP